MEAARLKSIELEAVPEWFSISDDDNSAHPR
jgi:hypothetical protein